ncbi:YbjN domain-containing protein [Zhouia spongiae]|uniref:YbjN domain-containing protein n=1 Tax=Zhouia spongiae TaxID=2202721 RepID=A0ABY3YM85_9FLAO|nr:YbjN domain-containing protein [Zhouia spongiae]UNY98601.1 YbjN domain-containing protein [Zhouia spongiae]
MNQNHTYIPPIQAKRAATRQDEKWDEAIALFNNKQHDKVLPTLLDYVGSHLQHQKKGDCYEIAHGSVVITITQTAEELLIKCPFLNIENAKKVPLMRRLAEIRMYPLNLSNVALENDLVYFSFSCPINLCEPYKIYGVLREICYYADSYDDEFIEKFGAAHLQEPDITPLPDDIKEEAYSNYQKIIEEGMRRFDHYMENRHENNAWYTLNITLKRIEFYAEPQGYLRTVIEKAIDGIFDRNTPFQNRLLNGKTSLEKLRSYSSAKFSEDLYQVATFIPHKYSGKKENIRENWGDSYAEIQEMIANARFEDAANLLQSCFYGLFYYNLVDESISKPITNAMAQANGLDWNQAAPVLLKGMEAIMEDSLFGDDYGMDLSKIMGEQMQQSMALMQQMMANFKTN